MLYVCMYVCMYVCVCMMKFRSCDCEDTQDSKVLNLSLREITVKEMSKAGLQQVREIQ